MIQAFYTLTHVHIQTHTRTTIIIMNIYVVYTKTEYNDDIAMMMIDDDVDVNDSKS